MRATRIPERDSCESIATNLDSSWLGKATLKKEVENAFFGSIDGAVLGR